MVSLDDLDPILERAGLSYYLPSITFAFLYYEFPNKTIYLYATLLVGLISTVMYVEEEILESIKDDLRGEGNHEIREDHSKTKEQIRSDYAHAAPWLYFETVMMISWFLSLISVAAIFLCCISWGRSFWLSALGYLNIIYIFGWVVDNIYRIKYKRYYFDRYVKDPSNSEKDSSDK